MADLNLDFGALQTASSRVQRVAESFARAERVSGEVAGYVGHDQLAKKVREFGENWDTVREQLGENLHAIAEYLNAVVETFDDLDRQQAKAVQDSSDEGHAGAPPAPHTEGAGVQ